MTRLEKELDDIINTFIFPPRMTKTFTNAGPSYPPYNIIRLDDSRKVLEMAVAGFKEDEINVVVEDGHLRVSGSKADTDSNDYIYKGIGTRSFEKSFALGPDTIVESAEFSDGILSVFVRYEIPEEKKPKQIPISRGERVYLTEEKE